MQAEHRSSLPRSPAPASPHPTPSPPHPSTLSILSWDGSPLPFNLRSPTLGEIRSSPERAYTWGKGSPALQSTSPSCPWEEVGNTAHSCKRLLQPGKRRKRTPQSVCMVTHYVGNSLSSPATVSLTPCAMGRRGRGIPALFSSYSLHKGTAKGVREAECSQRPSPRPWTPLWDCICLEAGDCPGPTSLCAPQVSGPDSPRPSQSLLGSTAQCSVKFTPGTGVPCRREKWEETWPPQEPFSSSLTGWKTASMLECVAWLSGLQRVKWGQNRTLLPGDSFPGSLFSSWASVLSLLKNNNSETGAEKPELFSL